MPLASDVQAGATVRLASALTSGGWDPGLGPPRRQPARRRPLRRHSNLRRYERLSAAAQAEERKVEQRWTDGLDQSISVLIASLFTRSACYGRLLAESSDRQLIGDRR